MLPVRAGAIEDCVVISGKGGLRVSCLSGDPQRVGRAFKLAPKQHRLRALLAKPSFLLLMATCAPLGSLLKGGVKKAKAKREVGGKVGSLINQWSSVRRTLEEEEERQARREQEAFDPEAQERKRRSEIEQWKSDQLKTGQAEDNANFMVRDAGMRRQACAHCAHCPCTRPLHPCSDAGNRPDVACS